MRQPLLAFVNRPVAIRYLVFMGFGASRRLPFRLDSVRSIGEEVKMRRSGSKDRPEQVYFLFKVGRINRQASAYCIFPLKTNPCRICL